MVDGRVASEPEFTGGLSFDLDVETACERCEGELPEDRATGEMGLHDEAIRGLVVMVCQPSARRMGWGGGGFLMVRGRTANAGRARLIGARSGLLPGFGQLKVVARRTKRGPFKNLHLDL